MINRRVSQSQNKKKISRHTVIVVSLVALVLLVGGSTYALTRPSSSNNSQTSTGNKASTNPEVKPPNSVDYTPPSTSDSQISDQTKQDTTPSSTPSSTISVLITRAGNIQDAQGNNTAVVVGSLVQGATSGTCTLMATQSGQTSVVQTNTVTTQANSYACPNFTIPYSSFPTGGPWKFTLTLSSNGQTSTNSWPEVVTVNK